jgi:hypothetical protein
LPKKGGKLRLVESEDEEEEEEEEEDQEEEEEEYEVDDAEENETEQVGRGENAGEEGESGVKKDGEDDLFASDDEGVDDDDAYAFGVELTEGWPE